MDEVSEMQEENTVGNGFNKSELQKMIQYFNELQIGE